MPTVTNREVEAINVITDALSDFPKSVQQTIMKTVTGMVKRGNFTNAASSTEITSSTRGKTAKRSYTSKRAVG